jgi:hypothetical protein
MKKLFFLLIFFAPQLCFSQPYNGWTILTRGDNGNLWLYNANEIKMQGMPPVIVSTPFNWVTVDGKTQPFHIWEFHCQSEQIKVGSNNLISIANETTTVRKIVLRMFCGVKQDEGLWFHFATLAVPDKPAVFSYFDLNSLRRVSSPINGVFLTYSNAKLETTLDKLAFADSYDVVMSCSELKFFWKVKNSRDDYKEVAIENRSNSPFMPARHNICNGIYSSFVKTESSALINLPDSSNKLIEKAKSQCLELGFKNGTEQFGKCVLQLSR